MNPLHIVLFYNTNRPLHVVTIITIWTTPYSHPESFLPHGGMVVKSIQNP